MEIIRDTRHLQNLAKLQKCFPSKETLVSAPRITVVDGSGYDAIIILAQFLCLSMCVVDRRHSHSLSIHTYTSIRKMYFFCFNFIPIKHGPFKLGFPTDNPYLQWYNIFCNHSVTTLYMFKHDNCWRSRLELFPWPTTVWFVIFYLKSLRMYDVTSDGTAMIILFLYKPK
jgi:hypothetical protein